MYETKKHPEWRALFERFRNEAYDTLLTYEEINKELPQGKDIRRGMGWQFTRFKREMLHEENKLLENSHKKGYRIVMPNEHTRLSSREVKRAERRLRHGVDIALHVDESELTERERVQINLIAVRLQNLHANLIGENRSIKQIQIGFKLPNVPRIKGDSK